LEDARIDPAIALVSAPTVLLIASAISVDSRM
jgi:hypothetical protein